MKPTVVLSTPTYALRMAEEAKSMGIDLSKSSIRITIHAGEAGASIPSTRKAIEDAWGAKTYDLYGIGEIHGIASECEMQDRLHVYEHHLHCLVVDEEGNEVKDGKVGEAVMTSFAQVAQPIIKYRTHDLVRWNKQKCPCGRTWAQFLGGVLGRTDNMITIKGTNVYPGAIEALLGDVDGTTESYEIHVTKERGLDNVLVKVEATPDINESKYQKIKEKAEELLRNKIGVRIEIEILKPGTLPRYELKTKLFFDHRKETK